MNWKRAPWWCVAATNGLVLLVSFVCSVVHANIDHQYARACWDLLSAVPNGAFLALAVAMLVDT